jgi:hypothetical protein
MFIIVEYFSDRDLHAFILEDSKKNELGTCDSEDDKCKFCKKEWLEKKGDETIN